MRLGRLTASGARHADNVARFRLRGPASARIGITFMEDHIDIDMPPVHVDCPDRVDAGDRPVLVVGPDRFTVLADAGP